MSKTTKIFIVLFSIIIAIVYFTREKQVPVAVVPEPTKALVDSTVEPSTKVCYFKETKGADYSDFNFISVNYNEGGKVAGIINWIPGEKDSLTGTYMGTVEANPGVPGYPERLNILYRGTGEGVTSEQQEILIVGDADIKQGYGEKLETKDGRYVIKDMTKLTYSDAIPKVDCSLVPERISTDYSLTNQKVRTND